MSDHRRLRARSPVNNPARTSAPVISAGAPTVNYGRSADLHSSLHAIPTRREHFVSPRSSGASIETATHYKIKPERDSLASPKTHGRSRRNTVDANSQPIIVTPTSRYSVVVGEPSSARSSRDSGIHDYREDAYIQPASSSHRHRNRAYSGYRGSSRSQHTIDNADISERHPHDREAPQDRLLRVGSARDGQMYPRARPITDDTLVRHPDTVKDDYGDNGYGYTNPKDLVEYDLETTNPRSSGGIPQRNRSRLESWDNSRGGRPASIGGYSDFQRPYESRGERERGPPPSTRGFDRIPGDRNSGIYHMPPSVHMPMPHDHIGSPLAHAPSSAYPADNLGVVQRRTSTRRPVSVYNDDRDRDRDRRERDRLGREEYDIVDGRSRPAHTFETHDNISSRGFGINPALMSSGAIVNVQPPAAIDSHPLDRVDRVEREDERLSPRNREEKRYHDSDERRYHVSERDSRRDDRDRERSERRPEPRPEHDDRDRNIGAGIAAGSIAAAAMGIGASATRDRESRNSDEDREREHARRSRRESDQYYKERPRRGTVRDDEPPIVDLSGRDPVERTSPREDGAPREAREREREYRDERAHDSDSRRERDRDSDNGRREPTREPRRESPLQSEKVDLSDRYPVIERNVAKEDMHYPTDASRSSPPVSHRDRDRDYDSSDNRGSRRDRVYDEATIGRETISSPLAMNDKEARDLCALREDIGLDRAIDDSPPPPRPPKEPIESLQTSPPTVGFSRQSTDRISDRPLDPPSRQTAAEDERSFVPPALTGEYSSGTQAPTTGTTSSRDSLPPRPRYSELDRGYSSTSTSSASCCSSAGTPRERSRERTRPSQSVQVVSPPRSPSSSTATLPVKGILKPPRVFPELPAEERPGVAPLIDKKTGKNWDGREMADVPPSARWTKISRKLVNPEALEKGKERYEVRDDFVVVLRVLTKDEIQGYAVITQQIRAQREDDERAERRRRRGGDTEIEDTEREDRHRRRRDDRDDETEEERAERKRKERERDERRRKYEDEETSEEREERKAKEREERHRRRREERYRSEPREDETADQAEERRRRERSERHERHERRRREKESRGGRDDDEDRERRHRRHRQRRERGSQSDTTDEERDDREERRRRRRERERD